MIELIETVNKYPKESVGIAIFIIVFLFILCATFVETVKIYKDK